MNTKTKLTALVTSSLLLGAGLSPASAAEPADKNPTTFSLPTEIAPVTAKTQASLDYDKVSVATSKAVPVAPVTVAEAPVQEETVVADPAPVADPQPVTAPVPAPAAPIAAAPVPTPVKAPAPVVAAPAPKPAPAPVAAPASGKGAAIAAAALGQIGVAQDCTRLATNSLAAVGIHYHGWPAGYLSLGRTVSAAEARPGDLAYYANGGMGLAHIAVYVGNGQAVHGGWNGGQTALFSVNVGSGPVFIRVA